MDEGLETRIRELIARGALEEAATEAMRGYGEAVMRFLASRTQDDDVVDEAFAQLGEDLWRGLASWNGQSSFMTWMFAVARNAAHRIERAPSRKKKRHTTVSRLDAAMEEVRSRTAPYLRTEIKDRFREMRESLSPDERTLLHLRLEEELGWDDIARIVEGADGDELKRASMRVRKRFSDVKKRLRERAEAEGLLDPDSD